MKQFLDVTYGLTCCVLYAMAALCFVMATIYGLGCVPALCSIDATIFALCGMGFGIVFLMLWSVRDEFYATLCRQF